MRLIAHSALHGLSYERTDRPVLRHRAAGGACRRPAPPRRGLPRSRDAVDPRFVVASVVALFIGWISAGTGSSARAASTRPERRGDRRLARAGHLRHAARTTSPALRAARRAETAASGKGRPIGPPLVSPVYTGPDRWGDEGGEVAEVEEKAYGAIPKWSPGRPKIRARRLLLQWVTSALALYIAAILVPGVKIEGFFGALIAAALIAILNAVVPPLIAALRLPYMLAVGFLLVLLLDAWMVKVAADLSDHTFKVDGVLHGADRLAGRGGRDRGARGAPGHQRRRRVLAARHAAHRAALAPPGRDRRARDRLPGDRRPRPADPAARHPRRARARDGALARVRARTASRSGRPTSRRRPAPPRRGCCSAPTTTSPPSAGWRRSRGAS